ncbi:hypothetical protein C8R44DRAFT_984922 [Mycena epipterygia]|nr:hypothetical protein C8R44DRAFT_984922 [Mycena epipterygia]
MPPVPSPLPASLRADKLSRLPTSIKIIAISAANGCLADLKLLQEAVYHRTSLFAGALPAFYANLDPADIPTSEKMDALDPAAGDTLYRALISVQALYRGFTSIPSELLSHLWPRVWPWLQFLDTYAYFLVGAPVAATNCVQSLLQIRQFQEDPHTAALIDLTPGVCILVARAWAFLLRAPIPNDDALAALCDLIGRPRQSRPLDDDILQLHIDELIEGAGGSPTDLAELVVTHIRLAFSEPQRSFSSRNAFILEGVMLFIQNSQYRPHLPAEAFLSCGILRAIIQTVCDLNAAGIDGMDRILDNCFSTIHWLLETAPSFLPSVTEAVKVGLLRAIVSCGSGPAAKVALPHLKRMFSHLASSSIHYRPLCLMRDAIPDTEALVRTRRFAASYISDSWSVFLKVLDRRFKLLEFFQSDRYYSVRACDNLACGEIVKRPDFKRCGGCRSRYYCSETCQRADWRRGGHRNTCRALLTASRRFLDPLSMRELNFLRAVLHQDYLSSKFDILLQQIEFMTHRPGVAFYTSLDYTSGTGNPTTEIHPHSAHDESSDPAERDLIVRAAKSGGLMELHRMCLPMGSRALMIWIPMRATSPRLHDGVREIAKELCGRGNLSDIRPQILRWIQELDMEAEDELLEVH